MGKDIQDLAAGAQNAHTSMLLNKCVTVVKLTDLLICAVQCFMTQVRFAFPML
jgi:hypothetical protein